jgi:hypothetical protein
MKGLTRVDHEGKKMYGWLVRAYGGGKTFSKYFSDHRYGGKEASRQNALEYLERLTREVKTQFADYKPRQNQPLYRKRPGSSNKTGVVGIHRCQTVNHGKPVAYWAATWNEDGKPKDKKYYFGEDTRSEEEAKKLAIEWRAKKVLEISNGSANFPPVLQDTIIKESSRRKIGSRRKAQLINWVPGLAITDWSTSFDNNAPDENKEVKKLEKFNEKRIQDLVSFLGISAVLFNWNDIDYEFGRGLFKGDIRSRCFWNTGGIRTDVLVEASGRIVIKQGVSPDPYYSEKKNGHIEIKNSCENAVENG